MAAEIGDNSATVNPPQLRSFVERVERLLSERKDLDEDIKSVLAEAKADGYDKKIIRRTIKLRAMDPDKRREEEMLLQVYCRALGVE